MWTLPAAPLGGCCLRQASGSERGRSGAGGGVTGLLRTARDGAVQASQSGKLQSANERAALRMTALMAVAPCSTAA